jgi:hypothetical protein
MSTNYVKYPRTPHLPWSLGATNDDRMLNNVNHFVGREVVVSVKQDGENTTMYRDHIHARSLDSKHHVSRAWVKDLWSKVRADIPEGWRICGENLYAVHSIQYHELPSYFMVFSIWCQDQCLNYDDTVEWTTLLGLCGVPVLYRGVWNEEAIKLLYTGTYGADEQEGYVVRVADGFRLDQFGQNMAKFVRPNHVQTDQHWMQHSMRINGLARK